MRSAAGPTPRGEELPPFDERRPPAGGSPRSRLAGSFLPDDDGDFDLEREVAAEDADQVAATDSDGADESGVRWNARSVAKKAQWADPERKAAMLAKRLSLIHI